MLTLSSRRRSTLAGNIRYYTGKCFPGKGGGARLAEEVGVTPQTLSNWISGKRLPTLPQIYCLAKVFDISPLTLCGMRSKRTINPKRIHLAVLQKLLEYCEKMNSKGANPRTTRKFLLSVMAITSNELCDWLFCKKKLMIVNVILIAFLHENNMLKVRFTAVA